MTTTILQKLEEAKSKNIQIAYMGLKITHEGNKPDFYNSIEDLEKAIKALDKTTLYKLKLDITTSSFLQISVTVMYLKPKEINKPYKIIQIARNINAFDLDFEKASLDVFKFWMDLYKKLNMKIQLLSDKEKKQLQKLVENNIFKIA